MILKYSPNKLHNTIEELELTSKITTLIWENGSGKSSILEAILHYSFETELCFIIAYSSGLNESFWKILRPYIDKNKNLTITWIEDEESLNINGFYFSKDWANILIFLAYSLKNEGYVKWFLNLERNKYLTEVWELMIQLHIDIWEAYIGQLTKSRWEHKSLETTKFHAKLSKLLNAVRLWTLWTDSAGNKWWWIKWRQNEYDFEKKSRFTSMLLFASEAKDIFGINKKEILNFLSLLTNKNYFINPGEVVLYFSNWIQLNDLSDGEFQLLTVYALLDLFDDTETVFLFDEIDSHLHYSNINKLWIDLNHTVWLVVTTTHIPDSIINNKDFSQIYMVNSWRIDPDNTVNSLLKRLGNISDSNILEKKLAGNCEHIVLIDDCTDWFIFLELAKRKLWSLYDDKLNKIIPIKCSSNCWDWSEETLCLEKIEWVAKFWKINSSARTRNIFLLCDKDEYPLSRIEDVKVKQFSKSQGQHKKPNELVDVIIRWTTRHPKLHYLIWKRREIENYLLCPSLLDHFSELEDLNADLPRTHRINVWWCTDNDSIRNYQAKEIIQKFAQKELSPGQSVWKDYEELRILISFIEVNEISEDIKKMHDFISDKIT